MSGFTDVWFNSGEWLNQVPQDQSNLRHTPCTHIHTRVAVRDTFSSFYLAEPTVQQNETQFTRSNHQNNDVTTIHLWFTQQEKTASSKFQFI